MTISLLQMLIVQLKPIFSNRIFCSPLTNSHSESIEVSFDEDFASTVRLSGHLLAPDNDCTRVTVRG